VTAKPQPMEPHGPIGRVFGWIMERTNRASYRAAADLLPSGRILEIGFGTGALVEHLAKRGATLVAGVDPSELMVDVARKRNAERAVDLRLGDASRLPWPNAHFDGVAALHSFQFWAPYEACLAEVRRALRPGGILVLILRFHGGSPKLQWLPNPISRRVDEPQATVAALQDAGFVNAAIVGKIGSSTIVTAHRAG
jgi:ubiquinone/menaquinone biosynthesis C-methylase UbiE